MKEQNKKKKEKEKSVGCTESLLESKRNCFLWPTYKGSRMHLMLGHASLSRTKYEEENEEKIYEGRREGGKSYWKDVENMCKFLRFCNCYVWPSV